MTSRRDEVLVTALALLDDVGLDAITIRKLAERLGVQPGALYRHFTSKRELLDAMVDRLVSEAPAADLSGDWPDQVRAIAAAARSGMLAHRDGARLMSTFYTPGKDALVAWERFVGLLLEAGLHLRDAHLAVDTIFSYVNGFTIEEQARGGMSREEKDRGFLAGIDLIVAGIKTRVTGPAEA